MKKILVIFLALICSFTLFTGCDDTNTYVDTSRVIIQKGQAFYKIIISMNATETETFAAEELSDFINESLGVTMQIQTDENVTLDENQKYISIGETKILEYCNFNFDYSSLNEEGFFIKTKGNLIVLNGANERGKLYSVYDFLERFIGIKFLTSDATYIPNLEELSVNSLDIVEVPYFAYRDIFGSAAMSFPLYSARIRVSSGINQADPVNLKYGGQYNSLYLDGDGHSFLKLLPPSIYEADHPDWYEGSDGNQLCLTNPEVLEEMLKVITEELEERPEIQWVIVGQMDNSSLCSCTDCLESNTVNGSESGTLIVFVNKVARGIQTWLDENEPNREIQIETFAYQSTFKPPVKSEDGVTVPYNDNVIPDSNVLVKLAGADVDYFHKISDSTNKHNSTFYQYMKDWSILTKNLYVYEYGCCFSGYFYYYSNLGVIKDNYITYKELGVNKILHQNNSLGGSDFQSLIKTYVISKLMWNPNRDVSALVNEFCSLYFGEDIAPYVLTVMDRFDSYYASQNFYGKINNLTDPAYMQPSNIPEKLLLDSIELLNQAEGVVNISDRTEIEKNEMIKRITSFKITPQYMLLVGYDTYYLTDMEGKITLAQELIENMEMCNIVYYRESRTETIYTLKQKYLN